MIRPCLRGHFVKKFEIYFIRLLLLVVLAVLAASPFWAFAHLQDGLARKTLDLTHLLSLGYLLLIALGLFLISPAFSGSKPREQAAPPHLKR